MWSISASAVAITLRAESGSSRLVSCARRASVSSRDAFGAPWWKSCALDAVLPGRALVDERLAQPHLGAPLAPAQAARLGRLGQVRRGVGRLELLDDEAPTGGRLQRRPDRLALEPAQEAPEALPIGRANPARPDLAGLGVERV
jgi:hypothetical protein